MSLASSFFQVSALSKSFLTQNGENFPILEKIEFSVSQNKILGILGASGCGKTTLLKILAGLEVPDSGTITADFKRPGASIGFVQQSEKLLPWRNILENVALGLELIGSLRAVARQTAKQILAEVGMSEFELSYPYQLSGGMTQRVLLARALITKPKLLLMDEPLGQLDIVARKELAAIVRRYVDQNQSAAIIVTHSVEEAVFISDFVMTLTRRPSQIFERFALEGNLATDSSFIELEHSNSFDPIMSSLLKAVTEERV